MYKFLFHNTIISDEMLSEPSAFQFLKFPIVSQISSLDTSFTNSAFDNYLHCKM